ncbi:MAG: prefoldin subunit beta [Candidatus Brockarchaeota archaeon]|nr:prefoldin subunit beta [Candidatus Brockarchaeota archaeon]MBO3808375.1 prefoldin subunit beta [Candidatus Brockarchaeota archaeon]
MSQELPLQLQEKLSRLQQLQQTLESLYIQKEQAKLEARELESALEALSSIDDNTPVYRITGRILVRKNRADLINELNEQMELVKVRISAIERQESKIRERAVELENELKNALAAGRGGQPA